MHDVPARPAPPLARPRVLHVITKLDLGGAEEVAISLVEALHDRNDFAVFAVMDIVQPSTVGRGMAARLARLGVPFSAGVRGHFKKGGVLVAAWRLARAMARVRPDVVHLHTETPELTFAVATVLSRRARKARVLRTVHNCELWIDWGGIGAWVTGRLAASEAVAVSHAAAQADAAIRTAHPRAPARVILNGVSPPPVSRGRAEGPFHLLFAGRLVAQKGADLLPEIVRIAHERASRRDVIVTIAGSGPLADAVAREIQGIAPGWRIELTAPLENLSARLSEFDAVLMPSRFEGLSLLAIETMMAQVPLIATDARGLAEAMPAGYPFRARVDDAAALGRLVAAIIADPEAAKAAVGGLRETLIERFSPARMAQAYASRYRALAHAAQGGGA